MEERELPLKISQSHSGSSKTARKGLFGSSLTLGSGTHFSVCGTSFLPSGVFWGHFMEGKFPFHWGHPERVLRVRWEHVRTLQWQPLIHRASAPQTTFPHSIRCNSEAQKCAWSRTDANVALPGISSRFNSLLPYRHRLSSPDQSKGHLHWCELLHPHWCENTHSAVTTVKECGENWARALMLSSWLFSGCG